MDTVTRRLALGLMGAAATGWTARADAAADAAKRTLHPSIHRYAPLLLPGSSPTTGLKARFMGTSTLLFDDGTDRILLDGFFSRPSLLESGLGPVTPNRDRIDRALISMGDPKTIRAVLTAHAHYDHALDAPTVARLKSATLVGSRSVKRIADGHGFKGPFEMLRGRQEMQFGPFRVTALPSPHSPHARFPGQIEEPLPLTTHVRHYREGGCFSFLIAHGDTRILITPGANAEPGDLKDVKADVVFLGTGTLGKQDASFFQQYWNEAVVQTGARVVIPIHWDNFFHSLDEPLRPLFGVVDDFDASMTAVMTRAEGRRVALMPLFDPVHMPPPVGL